MYSVTNSKKFNAFSVKINRMLAVSKTANIFTMTNRYLKDNKERKKNVCVLLDWFSVMIYTGFSEPIEGQKVYKLNDVVALNYTETSAGMFKYKYEVYWYGDHVANLLCGTKGKLISDGVAKLEMLNYMLYSFEWKNAYKDILQSLNAQLKNFTRLDIAIDGVNWMLPFLNDYVKQSNETKIVNLKGKAYMNSKILNQKTMEYRSFLVGAGKSPKKITIYNKTSELERSNKKYIESVWRKAGIDIDKDVCRVELRLNSEGVKAIRNFDIERLDDPKYLLSIFRTQASNFFEFTVKGGDSNHTRQKVVDILAFDELKIPMLEKEKRSVNDGRYKSKMSMHCHVKDILKNRYDNKQLESVLDVIDSDMMTYNLRDYYSKKLPEWIQTYYETMPEFQRDAHRLELLNGLVQN